MDHISIFGLGQVGLRVASLAAVRGISVTGIDVDQDTIEEINENNQCIKGVSIDSEAIEHIEAVTDPSEALNGTDAIFICIPTPLVDNYSVDLSYIQSVFDEIADIQLMGTDILIESTIPPGTTSEIGQQVLEDSGQTLDEDFYLAHCPERIDPGNSEWSLKDIPRVLGGVSEPSTESAFAVYDTLLDCELEVVSNAKTAACTKIVENAYRDINIAFVNEVSKSLNKTGIDVEEMLNAAGTKPYGFTQFRPGPGVGGDCIPVDPYMLINTAKNEGYSPNLLLRARDINDEMPLFVIRDIQDFLNAQDYTIKDTHILQLGVSFKGGVGSTVSSPALKVKSGLESRGGVIDTYDPYAEEQSTVSSPYIDADIAVILTDHPEFENLNLSLLRDSGIEILYDASFVTNPTEAIDSGLNYRRLGGSKG